MGWLSMKKCRECGEVIHFVPNGNGGYLPLDTEKYFIEPGEDGKDELVTLDGETVRGTIVDGMTATCMVGYALHFGRCGK